MTSHRIPRIALIDANVFFSPRLGDLFVYMHVEEVIRIHWTDEIAEEWTRNAIATSKKDPSGVKRRLEGMMKAVPDWQVANFIDFLPLVEETDSKDRHVAAAALKLAADEGDDVVLVTDNLQDFPIASLARHQVTPISSSDYLRRLYLEEPLAVVQIAEACRTKLQAPARTRLEYVALLMRLGCSLAHDLAQAWDVECPDRTPDGSLTYRSDQ